MGHRRLLDMSDDQRRSGIASEGGCPAKRLLSISREVGRKQNLAGFHGSFPRQRPARHHISIIAYWRANETRENYERHPEVTVLPLPQSQDDWRTWLALRRTSRCAARIAKCCKNRPKMSATLGSDARQTRR